MGCYIWYSEKGCAWTIRCTKYKQLTSQGPVYQLRSLIYVISLYSAPLWWLYGHVTAPYKSSYYYHYMAKYVRRLNKLFVVEIMVMKCCRYSLTIYSAKAVIVPYRMHWPLTGGLLHMVYCEEGTGWGCSPPGPSSLLAVPNVTAHPSTASVPFTVLLHV